MNVRALTRVQYDGRLYLPGDKFSMTPIHARTFVLLHRVEQIDEAPPVVAAVIETRELTPEASSAEVVDTKPKRGRPRKGYLRRDMRAED